MSQLVTSLKKIAAYTLSAISISSSHANMDQIFAPLPIRGEFLFNRHDAVLDGHLVDEESQFWRFTARLVISDESGKRFSRCTGALVQPRIILTSAHCFPAHMTRVKAEFDPQGDYENAIGINGRFQINPGYVFQTNTHKATSTGGLSINWERVNEFRELYNGNNPPSIAVIEASEKYLETTGSDLAVIVLDEAVPYPFKPIAFASQVETLTEEDVLYVIGYGHNSEDRKGLDKQLRYAPYRPVKVMKDQYNSARLIQSFPREDAASAPGDSGGPVVMEVGGRFLLVGIHAASKTREFAFCAVPQTHYNWVIDTVFTLLRTDQSL